MMISNTFVHVRLTVLIVFLLYAFSSAKGQVSDKFSDGNFSTNPVWVGDDSLFKVNTQFQLQSNATAGTSKDINLSTASNVVYGEWHLWAKFALSPSTANFCRFYLISDTFNIKGNINGYYIQYGGVTGNTDSITLYKQNNAQRTRILAGRPATVAKSVNTVRIKVLRDSAGVWSLFSDTTGFSNFQLEATATDNQITQSKYAGVFARFTSSNIQNFYFDDFYAGPKIVDTIPPGVDSIKVLSANSIRVVFNEKLDSASALLAANYFVNSIGIPQQVVFESIAQNVVILNFATPFVNKTNYQMVISDVSDFYGNISTAFNIPFSYFVPGKYDLLISELFPDPSPAVGLPEFEFIEIYNNSSFEVDLSGWSIADATSKASIPALKIKPDSFIILCPSTATGQFALYGKSIGITGFPSLNNTGDNIALFDSKNNIIHRVEYALSWYKDSSKIDGGYTLELTNPKTPCKDALVWQASTAADGGTPGKANAVWIKQPDTQAPVFVDLLQLDTNKLQWVFNEKMDSMSLLNSTLSISGGITVASRLVSKTQDTLTTTLSSRLQSAMSYVASIAGVTDCSGNPIQLPAQKSVYVLPVQDAAVNDVLINEIMADPDPSVGLPPAEYIELYNRSAKFISLKGWKFSDATSSVILPQYILPPDSHVILCATSSASSLASFGKVLGLAGFPSINNTGEALVLTDSKGVDINAVTFSDSWYKDATKKDGGYSLELINPNNICYESQNWNASNDVKGGTPGKRNSVFVNTPDTAAPVVISMRVDSMQVTLVFNKRMNPATYIKDSFLLTTNTIQTVTYSGKFSDSLTVTFTNKLLPEQSNKILLNGVRDCSGNLLKAVDSFTYYPVGIAASYDILINEIMPDPDPVVGLPNAEYIELYNRSQGALSLKGWTISDGVTTATLPDYKLLRNGYLLICRTGDDAKFSITNKLGLSSFPALSNEGKRLVLKDNLGRVIHTINYTPLWHNDISKSSGGWSLEMIDPAYACGGKDNWASSLNKMGGTPGFINSVKASNPDNTKPTVTDAYPLNSQQVRFTFSEPVDSLKFYDQTFFSSADLGKANKQSLVAPDNLSAIAIFDSVMKSGRVYSVKINALSDCFGNKQEREATLTIGIPEAMQSGDVVINELLFNPRTGGADFVEVYNKSAKVLDLKELFIANTNADRSIKDSYVTVQEGKLFFPNTYVVFSESTSSILSNYLVVSPERLYNAQLPSFNDDEGSCVLVNKQNERVDELYYDDKMHFALLDNKEGVSLERIDFNRPSADRSNWTSAASSAGYATPTYRNSQYATTAYANQMLQVSPEVFSPDGDGFNDVINFSYDIGEPGYTGNLYIFNSGGMMIKHLLRNEVLGTKGIYSWDGVTDNNEKAAIGIYIALFEVFNLKGETRKTKTTLVVGAKL